MSRPKQIVTPSLARLGKAAPTEWPFGAELPAYRRGYCIQAASVWKPLLKHRNLKPASAVSMSLRMLACTSRWVLSTRSSGQGPSAPGPRRFRLPRSGSVLSQGARDFCHWFFFSRPGVCESTVWPTQAKYLGHYLLSAFFPSALAPFSVSTHVSLPPFTLTFFFFF